MFMGMAGLKAGEEGGVAPPPPLGATPAFSSVGATTSSATLAATHTIAHPATVTAGDLLLCLALGRNTADAALTMHASMSGAGWQHLTGSPFQPTTARCLLVAWKIAAGTEGGTNIPGGIVATGGTGGQAFIGHCQRWTAADGFAAVPFESITSALESNNVTTNAPTVTPTDDNRRGVAIFGGNGAATSFSYTGETGGDWTVAAHITHATGAVINTQSADLSAGTPISGGSVTMSTAAGGPLVGFALVPSGTSGNGNGEPAAPLWMAYCPSYDSGTMPGTEVPFSLGITHLKHFAANPELSGSNPIADLTHFSPPMIPTHLANIKSARTAASSTAKILMVVGGANTDTGFTACMTYNTGTVSVTNGSATVTGTGTTWTTAFNGLPFSIKREGVLYTVSTVASATSLTLTTTYTGTTGAGKTYAIDWPTRRQAFIDDITGKMTANGYDGVDIDWEGGGANATLDEYTRLNTFHAELGAQVHGLGGVFTSSSFGRKGPAFTAAKAAFKAAVLDPGHIDYMYMQFIAMVTPNASGSRVWHPSATNHNTSDYGTPTGNTAVGVTEALATLLSTDGWPANKIIVGHQWGNLQWDGGVMTAPVSGRGARFPLDNYSGGTVPDASTEVLYRELVARAEYPADLERDMLAGDVPFLAHTGASAAADYFLQFEDAQSIAYKTAYALSQGVAGMGVWHISSDYNAAGGTVATKHPLAAALATALFG